VEVDRPGAGEALDARLGHRVRAADDDDTHADPEQVVREHVAAFNDHDLDRLLACLTADATWVTGTDHFRGAAELAKLFGRAFSELSPTLTITTMMVDGNRVSCELSERFVVEGVARVEHIAGFYRVESGRITGVKIYREGSADPGGSIGS